VLAHELGHALLGHTGAPPFGDVAWLAVRQEAQADRWAARRLLRGADVSRALIAFPDDRAAAAEELDVTVEVLATWLRHIRSDDRLPGARRSADGAAAA
jgi:hypothetical protein